jgi:hypothetical protein
MRGELASDGVHVVLLSARRCCVVVHPCSATSRRGIASIGNNSVAADASGSGRVEVHQPIWCPLRASASPTQEHDRWPLAPRARLDPHQHACRRAAPGRLSSK